MEKNPHVLEDMRVNAVSAGKYAGLEQVGEQVLSGFINAKIKVDMMKST